MYKWALKELELLEKRCDEEELCMQKMVTSNVMEIFNTGGPISIFANQGHSGFSANYTKKLITRLLDHKPILPLTGDEDEWHGDIFDNSSGVVTQQNKRCSAVFRDNFDNSTARYIHGKVFSDDGGKTWYTSRDSSVSITFPYTVPDHPEKIFLNKKKTKVQPEKEK